MATMKLNGRAFSVSQVDKFIDFLESLPDDEVLSIDEISQRSIVDVTRKTVQGWTKHNIRLSFYRYLVPVGSGTGFYVFGNPRAIVAIRKQTEKSLRRK